MRWFEDIHSKHGVSPDPEKCAVIRNWPSSKSNAEVKNFLQTVQFNSKFMGRGPGEFSYLEVTKPLRALTKKNARVICGETERCQLLKK